jgi:pantoate--beta-alanine ligase
MLFIESITELRQEISKQKLANKKIAFVPTMGNLHEGHLQLIDLAKKHGDFVVCSIFVNPTQFGENEDFDSYPRTLESDQEKLNNRACDLLFFPKVSEIYPKGNNKKHLSIVHVPSITEELCGKSRPGHFDGVSTVVSKLFNLVLPDCAVFGEKDFQQLAVIRAFSEDLNFPIEIIGASITREENGLAMSSRNGYLSDSEKVKATFLFQLLTRTKNEILNGNIDYETIQKTALKELITQGFKPDYFEIRNSLTLKTADEKDKEIILLVAAYLGKTRLIDNISLNLN